MCGNTSDLAIANISERVGSSACPLCNSPLSASTFNGEDKPRLEAIDRELTEIKQDLRGAHKRLDKLRHEETAAREKWEATKQELDVFNEQNTATLESLRLLLNRTTGEASLTAYRDQLIVLENDKRTASDKREQLKAGLLSLQRALEREYLSAETTFVPRFADWRTTSSGCH